MGVKVKLDESLSESVGGPLASHQHMVLTVLGQGWSGFKDSAIWPLIQEEKAFFITTDKEFANIQRFPPGTHAGVLLLRPARESLPEFRKLLSSVLEKFPLESLACCTVVASPAEIRIRRPSSWPEASKS